MSARPGLEIAVVSPAGARTAREHGADRVELCTGLELGGLTPSTAAVEAVVETGPPVHVLVRCRPGDFVYDDEEVALMAAEVRTALRASARGVVVGALTPDGALDTNALAVLVGAARDTDPAAQITLHRAVDQASDPVAAVAALPGLGITRVLTSGGAPAAIGGSAVLTAMAAAAPGVDVAAGGGVRPGDIAGLLAAGATSVHLSAKSRATPRRAAGWVPLGAGGASAADDTHFVTDGTVVAEARRALDAAAGRRMPEEAGGAPR
ncbi:copper homeostasis protein CutC [Streptomyces sp. MH60]|uniref:copper homeostasis protein CutC n=1 Tax=Streptomyces sp. MH60 TaxID=1940758 RepID=UPI000CEDB8D5|nr:copper homeostasis protein CutC [Streptomyces sp. MH60]PPS83301.1 Copper homeostasis protein CutC [Streptomyces sp. MH60]